MLSAFGFFFLLSVLLQPLTMERVTNFRDPGRRPTFLGVKKTDFGISEGVQPHSGPERGLFQYILMR